jgi:Ca2+-binding RTX toxin-like protein
MSDSLALGDWTDQLAGSHLDLTGFHLNFEDSFDIMSVGSSGASPEGATWFAPVRPTFGGAAFVGPDGPVSPFSVADGALTIRMQQVDGGWQSGHMQSINSRGEGYAQTYGYFEISAKFPAGAGSWPAFWLLSSDPTKPRVEIDVVEAYGRDDFDGHHAAVHFTPATGSTLPEKVHNSEYTNVPGSMFDGAFHTYGALVTPEWIIVYYDQLEITRFPSNEYVGTPLYLAVDLAMYEPEAPQAAGRYDMVVDYVRAWADPSVTGLALNGGASADTLSGSAHADTLDGGAGGDVLRGGAGSDIYYVDSATDQVVEVTGSGIDEVHSAVTFSAGSQHIETIRLTGSGDLKATGNGLGNALYGNSGDNLLNGKGGADTMSGGAGADVYYVDHKGDVIYDFADAGSDKVYASVSYSLAGPGKKLENLTLTGSADIDATGNDFRNVLVGNAGANVLHGGAGDDTMQGGLGDDIYYVTDGADKVIEAVGAGNDTIVSSWTLSLGNIRSVENLTLSGGAALNGFGTAGANILKGNLGANLLDAREGSDTLSGGGGADTFIGGSGQDVFRFDTAPANGDADYVKDFRSVDDTLHLDDSVFSGLAQGKLAAEAFRLGKAAADATDRIVYDQTTGALYWDVDGAGGAVQVKVAGLVAGTSLALGDVFVV